MFIDEVRDACMALPHVTERMPYGPDCLVFEIGGKQFCLLDLTGKWQFFNLKCDPDYSVDLREQFGAIRPGYHMNKRHWISVDYSGDVPDALQHDLIAHAYQQTMKGLPKYIREQLKA